MRNDPKRQRVIAEARETLDTRQLATALVNWALDHSNKNAEGQSVNKSAPAEAEAEA
jgi:hypothetical protein